VKLILFDIDGTLVLTGGAGGRAMGRACADVFGGDVATPVPMAGRTDTWIVTQMAAQHGQTVDAELLARFRDVYVAHLVREIARPVGRHGVLPGVAETLAALAAREDVYVGLLTGNFRRGAEIKLSHFDIWRRFETGAFGEDSADRNALLQVALERVHASGGPVCEPSDVVIVGDTPHDVAVAVAGGARSLAVATGPYDLDALRASGATVALADLSDGPAVLRALGLRAGPD
jgi:phosphoglycolate phosphatase-like HAD superfamily hydrolase